MQRGQPGVVLRVGVTAAGQQSFEYFVVANSNGMIDRRIPEIVPYVGVGTARQECLDGADDA